MLHYEYCKERKISIVRVAINEDGQDWDLDECPVKTLGNHGLSTAIGTSPVPVSDPIAGGGESLAGF